MKNIFFILLIACSNISCMQDSKIDKKIILIYKGESDKPIPAIILSVNEVVSPRYSYYEFYRVEEKLFDALKKAIEQDKFLNKTISEKELIYEISISNNNKLSLYVCDDKQCMDFTLSEMVNTLTLHKAPSEIIKSFENIKSRLK
jgi:hypothetical protein